MGQRVVFQVAARQCHLAVDTGLVASRRPQGVVGFVAAPADGTFVQPAFETAHTVAALTVTVDKVAVTFWGAGIGVHGQVFRRQAEIHTVVFGDGDTHADTRAGGGGFILFRAGRGFARIVGFTVNVVAEAHTVGGEIRDGKRQRTVDGGFTARYAGGR